MMETEEQFYKVRRALGADGGTTVRMELTPLSRTHKRDEDGKHAACF